MRYAVLLSLIFAVSATETHAQYFAVAEVSFNTYDMESMKAFQDTILATYPTSLPVQTVTRFPPFPGFAVVFGRAASERFSYGLSLQYQSTGGRLYYEDYSGIVRFDQLLKAISIGVMGRMQINRSEKWPIIGSLTVAWVRSNATLTDEVNINGTSQVAVLELSSTNFSFRPMLGLQRNLAGGFFANLQFGYELHVTGKLGNQSGTTEYTVQWDGLRGALGVGLFLSRKEQTAP